MDYEIDKMLNEIEYSDKRKIRLPEKLDNGTAVRWSRGKSGSSTNLIIIPFVYILLIVIIVRSGMDDEEKEEKLMQKEILRGLPRFCNQLFLMMNAGMILSDSFEMICGSYKAFGEEELSVFEKELVRICDDNRDHRISTAALLSEFASKHNVKEFVRIAAILTENEKRGSGIVESLSRESKYLWDDRKIRAREGGKLIDTKMTYPLSMLLILLIVITVSPVMLGM
jgi:type II secretory pathway component PulF